MRAAAAELAAEVDEDLSAFLQRTYGITLQEYAARGAAPPPGATAGSHGAGPSGNADVYMHGSDDDDDDDDDVAMEEPAARHGGHGVAGPGLGPSGSADWAADLMAAGAEQVVAGGSGGAGPSSQAGAARDQGEADDAEEDEEDWENAEAVDDEATLEEEEALARAEGMVCFVCCACGVSVSHSEATYGNAPNLSG